MPRPCAQAVDRAARFGVAVGAHPSYPDPANFGRVPMAMAPDDLRATVAAQLRALAEAGADIRYVKPHGALYHAVTADAGAGRRGRLGDRRPRRRGSVARSPCSGCAARSSGPRSRRACRSCTRRSSTAGTGPTARSFPAASRARCCTSPTRSPPARCASSARAWSTRSTALRCAVEAASLCVARRLARRGRHGPRGARRARRRRHRRCERHGERAERRGAALPADGRACDPVEVDSLDGRGRSARAGSRRRALPESSTSSRRPARSSCAPTPHGCRSRRRGRGSPARRRMPHPPAAADAPVDRAGGRLRRRRPRRHRSPPRDESRRARPTAHGRRVVGGVHRLRARLRLPHQPRLALRCAPARDPAHPCAPRVRSGSPAGFTGAYPRDTPGGWRLIGTTDAPLFDPDAASPALLAPGAPRALPSGHDRAGRSPPCRDSRARTVRSLGCLIRDAGLRIVEPGLLATLQDLGRPGAASLGVAHPAPSTAAPRAPRTGWSAIPRPLLSSKPRWAGSARSRSATCGSR